MASDANIIALQVDDLRAELDKLLDTAELVPEPNEVSQFGGASSGSAAAFHADLQNALKRADTSAQTLTGHLYELDRLVRMAIVDLTGHDVVAETTYSSMNGELPGPTYSMPPTANAAGY